MGWQSIVSNASMNFASQLVVKQDFASIDYLDVGLAGLGGLGWGQVVFGGLGGLGDFTSEKGFVFNKTSSAYGADIGTGVASGLIGYGLNLPGLNLSGPWQNAGGFLNNMFGDGLNSILNPGKP